MIWDVWTPQVGAICTKQRHAFDKPNGHLARLLVVNIENVFVVLRHGFEDCLSANIIDMLNMGMGCATFWAWFRHLAVLGGCLAIPGGNGSGNFGHGWGSFRGLFWAWAGGSFTGQFLARAGVTRTVQGTGVICSKSLPNHVFTN